MKEIKLLDALDGVLDNLVDSGDSTGELKDFRNVIESFIQDNVQYLEERTYQQNGEDWELKEIE